MVKNLPANARDTGDVGWIPGSGRSPGGGNSNPLQYSCLENPMDRGSWQGLQSMGSQRVDTTERLSTQVGTQGERSANVEGRPRGHRHKSGTVKMPAKQREVGRGLAHMFSHGPQKKQSCTRLKSLHIPASVSSSITLFPLILKGPPHLKPHGESLLPSWGSSEESSKSQDAPVEKPSPEPHGAMT